MSKKQVAFYGIKNISIDNSICGRIIIYLLHHSDSKSKPESIFLSVTRNFNGVNFVTFWKFHFYCLSSGIQVSPLTWLKARCQLLLLPTKLCLQDKARHRYDPFCMIFQTIEISTEVKNKYMRKYTHLRHARLLIGHYSMTGYLNREGFSAMF